MTMNYENIYTPAYILEEKLLRQNLELIHSVQQRAGVQIILAFKGFSMWSAFPMVRQYLSGATASSLGEARLCFEEMKTLSHTYCVAYKPDEFDEIMQYSGHITFNSIRQYEQYKDRVQAFEGHRISCGIRVNPEYSEVGTDLYNPCTPGSRLGELHEQFGRKLPEGIEGLHFHALCESGSDELEKVLQNFEEHFGTFIPQIRWLNVGGGHLMTRKGYDIEKLVQVLKDFKAKYPHLHIIMEPGSAIAWQTGVLVARVLDIMQSRINKTLICDISFTAHMPDTLEMPYRPIIRGAKSEVTASDPHQYRIGGMSCLSGDYMEVYSFEKEPQINDIIIFEDMIHYTMVKTTTFNGVGHPDIAILKENGDYEVVKHFGYEDYKNRLS